jgi:DNA-directed RNA polymerase specialized sigma24 family protein
VSEPHAASRAPSPLVDLVRREELELVLDTMSLLSQTSRDIVVLRYLERQRFETIGVRIGRSPHQVRSICHKAIVRMRRMLADAPSQAVREPGGLET